MRQERTPADWYRMLAWIYAWYGQERARGLLYSLYPNLQKRTQTDVGDATEQAARHVMEVVTGSSGSAMIHVAWIGEIKIKAEIRKKDNIDM